MHIFPHLQYGVIISILHICYDECTATLTANHMKVEKKVRLVLEVQHKGLSGMWYINLIIKTQKIPTLTRQSDKNLMENRHKPELDQWYHSTFSGPFKQTILQEIKKFELSMWTNLTIDLITKPPPIHGKRQGPHSPKKE